MLNPEWNDAKDPTISNFYTIGKTVNFEYALLSAIRSKSTQYHIPTQVECNTTLRQGSSVT